MHDDLTPSHWDVPAFDLVAERAKAEKDSQLYGTGFLVDDVHVPPSRVNIIRKAYWPHVTTTELYNDLAQVLRDKGASDEWIAYVMGDLQLASTQYAHTRWIQGYEAGKRGDPTPNPQGPFDSVLDKSQLDYSARSASDQTLPEHLRWKGEGVPPAKWQADDGSIVYRSYEDYCDD